MLSLYLYLLRENPRLERTIGFSTISKSVHKLSLAAWEWLTWGSERTFERTSEVELTFDKAVNLPLSNLLRKNSTDGFLDRICLICSKKRIFLEHLRMVVYATYTSYCFLTHFFKVWWNSVLLKKVPFFRKKK